LCSKVTTDSGTDITLTDRKNEFVENNMTLCEEDCDLADYDYDSEKVKCSCKIKIKLPLIDEIKFDKKKLYDSFIDIKNIANFNLMKCYKEVLTKDCIKKNYGLFVFEFINSFFYINKIKTNNIRKNSMLETKKGKLNKNKNKKRNKKKNPFTKVETKNSPPKKKGKKKVNKKSTIEKNKYSNIKNIITKEPLKYNDSELNGLEYKKAILYDKRPFYEYYFSLLKVNHLLFFSFYCNNNDYNPQIIKSFLFFFYFSVDFTINALFFSDDTMHKIYVDEGSYNFIYQLPQIIYSSLISAIINFVIKNLSSPEKEVIEIKNVKCRKNLDSKVNKNLKCIKIKLALFFIITFLLLSFFTFYITCFCGVYINTQVHLIKDSLVSFLLSLIYPFGIFFLPCMLRKLSLSDKNKDRECIYKLSQFVQDL